MLAKSSDEDLKALATKDLAGSNDPSAIEANGDAW
jgi:hypothetical protein